jgi:retron-type reverse transcriptase
MKDCILTRGDLMEMLLKDELLEYLKENGADLRKSILEGSYKSLPVRRVEISKNNGGKRKLGIPTVVD